MVDQMYFESSKRTLSKNVSLRLPYMFVRLFLVGSTTGLRPMSWHCKQLRLSVDTHARSSLRGKTNIW